MSKKKFDLTTVASTLTKKSNDFLKDVQSQIVAEEEQALKDFVKGAYRLSLEKQKMVESLQKDIVNINEAIEDASKGHWDKISAIKIPARFFEEATLRRHGKSLLSGSEEVRFVDLYVPEE